MGLVMKRSEIDGTAYLTPEQSEDRPETCSRCGETIDDSPEASPQDMRSDDKPDLCMVCFSIVEDGGDEDSEPAEGDLTTEDHEAWYQYGKYVLGTDPDNWEWQLNQFMERERFWPNVWWISDHGNAHRLEVNSDATCQHAPDRRNAEITTETHSDAAVKVPCTFGCGTFAYIEVDAYQIARRTDDDDFEWGDEN